MVYFFISLPRKGHKECIDGMFLEYGADGVFMILYQFTHQKLLTKFNNLSLKIFEWLAKNRGESHLLKRPLELKLI